jgi:predicted DNA binding CopG/RHH family protein
MAAKTKYTNERIGENRVVPDFLPSPDELAFRDEGVKVTIALSKRSVEFFKSHAAKNQTQYQRMIRQLLNAYVDAYAQSPTRSAKGTIRKRAAR